MQIPPFMATLGMMYMAKGLSLVISGLKPIYFNDTPHIRDDCDGFHFGLHLFRLRYSQRGADLIRRSHRCGPDPYLKRSWAVITLPLAAMKKRPVSLASMSTSGRLLFTSSAVFCRFRWCPDACPPEFCTARLGQGYELDAIAAVVIGGTSLSGGEGTILGTIIGAFVISVLTNGLRILSVPQEWQIVVTGAILSSRCTWILSAAASRKVRRMGGSVASRNDTDGFNSLRLLAPPGAQTINHNQKEIVMKNVAYCVSACCRMLPRVGAAPPHRLSRLRRKRPAAKQAPAANPRRCEALHPGDFQGLPAPVLASG